jgi:hypothetical protein
MDIRYVRAALVAASVLVSNAAVADDAVPAPKDAALVKEVKMDCTDIQNRKDCINTALGSTTQGAPVVADLVQVVAQVVIDRATQAAWGLLRDHLEETLHCEQPKLFPVVCKLLSDVRIQDLISSPRTLLDASSVDLLGIVINAVESPQVLGEKTADLPLMLHHIQDAWYRTGGGAATLAFSHGVLHKKMLEAVAATDAFKCPASTKTDPDTTINQALQLVGDCLLKRGDGEPAFTALSTCDVTKLLSGCKMDEKHQADVLRLYEVASVALTAKSEKSVLATLDYLFEVARIKANGADEKLRVINALDSVVRGLIQQDWVKIASGATSVLEEAAKLKTFGGNVQEVKTFLRIMASVGQYAATYGNNPAQESREELQKGRREIIEALISSLVSRSDRPGGAVFSLGGSFGLGGVYRRSLDGETTGGAGPFMLPLGVAMQTYPKAPTDAYGFHLQLGFLDVGQYVAWEGGEAEVGSPELKDALALTLTMGPWFGSREAPVFVGPYAGISPFLRKDGTPSLFVGGMVGVYVPFIDFN